MKQKNQQGDTSDCQTEEGITISMIDTIGFLLGQLSERDLESNNIKEALKDLHFNGKSNMKTYTIFVHEKIN